MSDSKLTTTNDQSSHFVHVIVTCKNMYVWCKIKKTIKEHKYAQGGRLRLQLLLHTTKTYL